jgi:hypothetical protein
MGWSCRKEASDTMRAWSDACHASSGSSNVWKSADGSEFFFEVSRKEHDDGAITGSIIALGAPSGPDGARYGRKAGSFRIDPDGRVARAPAFLKAASAVRKAA